MTAFLQLPGRFQVPVFRISLITEAVPEDHSKLVPRAGFVILVRRAGRDPDSAHGYAECLLPNMC